MYKAPVEITIPLKTEPEVVETLVRAMATTGLEFRVNLDVDEEFEAWIIFTPIEGEPIDGLWQIQDLSNSKWRSLETGIAGIFGHMEWVEGALGKDGEEI